MNEFIDKLLKQEETQPKKSLLISVRETDLQKLDKIAKGFSKLSNGAGFSRNVLIESAITAFIEGAETYIREKYEANPDLSKMHGKFIPNDEFKKRVMQLIKGGKSQRAAMEAVANEMNIKLADSYYEYPGSHIYRWRNQGYK